MISRGEPYVVPLNFVYDEGIVYFHCSLEGRKIEAIRANPGVCLEFDAMHGVSVKKQTTYYTSAVAWGDAVFVSDTSKVKQVLEMICIKYLDCSPEITEGMAERTCVVSIRVNSLTGREKKS